MRKVNRNGIGKGCLFSVLALGISLVLTSLLLAVFSGSNTTSVGAFLESGGVIIVWWILFFPVYGILLRIDRRRQKRSSPEERLP
jgi:hypothetical protein